MAEELSTVTESQELNQTRIEQNNRAKKSRSFPGRPTSQGGRETWWRFCVRHAGQSGLTHGDYWSCEANDNVLRRYISKENDPTITEWSLEKKLLRTVGLFWPSDRNHSARMSGKQI